MTYSFHVSRYYVRPLGLSFVCTVSYASGMPSKIVVRAKGESYVFRAATAKNLRLSVSGSEHRGLQLETAEHGNTDIE
ncbi:hypothetical protein EOA75_19690 [Mesorhizobium sp. M1A.F.Ca.IN.022.07.1.1]|uniref:hypothetical protein n=1 Tax=unclassified Mesorhizobium TaxID=325217 RepID=UPI000FCB0FD1|nr:MULTISPECIES: hypothetical protein [unclassified Mesorhizobium]RUV91414.1 hypothetical protein EOA75_19690 [Mesorhizobium sp. M1A.F.Ca.IN.022.07.1.1]RWM65088.1 MAG: hypothetical protein EOR82_31465 [Mesorhizobium sp.]RWM89341.1 MAG: hypothetical protein EOR86_29785 [Mesorhizobium sp.]TIS70945.1 MAG: hypothetical protein E5X11_02900 [Mesorhizobium sp.]TJV54536.1 MAG: hypothetical protein E5X82_31410 [Mesorhizobium sp.]